jgi:antirestriction protein ArdC
MATKTAKRTTKKTTKADTAKVEIKWAELLEQALTMPGSRTNLFNRFYEYSFLNMIWLTVQGVNEPCGPYGLWKKLGRQVRKGSKGKTVLHPVIVTKRDPETKQPILHNGKEQRIVIGFAPRATVFTFSDTDGEDLIIPELPEWSLDLALETLDIKRVKFAINTGNVGGYSKDRELAINPTTTAPLSTAFHEIAHIVLGHTSKEGLEEYQTHRGAMEFEAEAVAYLLRNELEVHEKDFDVDHSRTYIQNWLGGQEVEEKSIRRVSTATNTILKAGRPARKTDES